jgi:hypothetical protein
MKKVSTTGAQKIEKGLAPPTLVERRFIANDPFVRVYDYPVFLESDRVNGLIVSEKLSGNPRTDERVSRAVPKVERHLALHVSSSVSN